MGYLWYSRALYNYPCIILITVFIISTICLLISTLVSKTPDFSDPQIGFEARGTPLAQRLRAWTNLVEESTPRGVLINNPLEYFYFLRETALQEYKFQIKVNKRKDKKKNKKAKNNSIQHNNVKDEKSQLIIANYNLQKNHSFKDSKNYSRSNDNKSQIFPAKLVSDSGVFCNMPNAAYSRLVLSTKSEKKSLWSLQGFAAQCFIDSILRNSTQFPLLCETQIGFPDRCCSSWFPANYVALLVNKTSCSEVTEKDLIFVKDIIQRCYYYYKNLELIPECSEDTKCQNVVPPECYKFDAVYYLIHYHLDIHFLSNTSSSFGSNLNNVMIILPIAASSASLDFYNSLDLKNLQYDSFYVPAIQFGLKSVLFDYLLVKDSKYIVFGGIFVSLCTWLYTASLLITLITILIVFFSLGIAYTIYTILLGIKLFPFMNLLAIIVAIGIGADDAFIFCKIWQYNKRQKQMNSKTMIPMLVHETMKHAVPAMLVTTLTTVTAFFSSLVSNVTAINCFSLFAGITVIINFLLMITMLPCSLLLNENFRKKTNLLPNLVKKKMSLLSDFGNRIIIQGNDLLIRIIILWKWIWFLFFSILAMMGLFIVFYFPGLQLPDSPDFQLFDNLHSFEQYDSIYANEFWFEKFDQRIERRALPLRFVWGILPIDNGYYYDPASRGSLVFDESFNITSKESQLWLLQFCRDLRRQKFYQSTLGPLLPNCFIESLQPWMERPCADPVDLTINHFPCCNENSFPYESTILEICAARAVAEMYRTPYHLWNYETARTAGLKFRKEDYLVNKDVITKRINSTMELNVIPKIQAVVIEYDSNYTYSLSFSEMNRFFTEIEMWMKNQLVSAPSGMKNGWFVSHLEFYELQRTLQEGTMTSIVVSMILALTVVAIFTRNIFISFYAILAVGASIIVSIAMLILLGWKLNVLESLSISTAIGLSVDFSLHYGMCYKSSNNAKTNIERVKLVIEKMGTPTLMAALTSGAAGALMLSSQVLPYIQIGKFLVVIMTITWLYATFFLCPLLANVGPSLDQSKLHRYQEPNESHKNTESVAEVNINHCYNPNGTNNCNIPMEASSSTNILLQSITLTHNFEE